MVDYFMAECFSNEYECLRKNIKECGLTDPKVEVDSDDQLKWLRDVHVHVLNKTRFAGTERRQRRKVVRVFLRLKIIRAYLDIHHICKFSQQIFGQTNH